MYIMAENMCVLPVRCKGCNTVFDLWYDLEGEDAGMVVLANDREAEKFLNQSFCWRCRKAVKLGMRTEDDFGVSEEETEYEVEFE